MIGWFALAAGLGFVLWLTRGDRSLRIMLVSAYGARAVAALAHLYVFGLQSDSAKFDQLARELASGGIGAVILGIDMGSQYLYAMMVVGGVYSILGPSPLAAQTINVVLGTAVVLLTYRTTLELWGRRAALVAGWIVALLPSAIYYSGALLREAFVVLPMLAAMLYLARWARGGRTRQLLAALALIIVSALFHPAGYFALVAVPVGIAAHTLLIRRAVSRRAAVTVVQVAVVIGLATGAVAALHATVGSYRLSWLYAGRSVTDVTVSMVQRPSARVEGREDLFYSATGRFGAGDTAFLLAARPAEFLFRPFVWEGYRVLDVARGGEALLMLLIFALLIGMFPGILRRQDTFVLLSVALMLVAVYAVGSEEMQQAFRHRSKLIPLFVILVSPAIAGLLSGRANAGVAKAPEVVTVSPSEPVAAPAE